MDKKKIVNAAREKARENSQAKDDDKSFIGGIMDTFMNIVGSDDESARESGSSGKFSGRKPQSQTGGRVSSVGRSVADQLHRKK